MSLAAANQSSARVESVGWSRPGKGLPYFRADLVTQTRLSLPLNSNAASTRKFEQASKPQLAVLSTTAAQRIQPSVQLGQQIPRRSLAHRPVLEQSSINSREHSSSGYARRALSTRSRSFSHAETDGGTDLVPFSSWSAFRVISISRRIL